MGKRIVIMAGGTGGHVFPALAVAQLLTVRGWQVSWMGTRQGLESRVVPENNIAIDWLSVAGLRGKGLLAKLKAPLMLLQACCQAVTILRSRKADVVLGMGGFVAGPGGLMAKMLNIPLVIHEQNRVPGTTNRLLAGLAKAVLEAFPGSFNKQQRAVFTGNPLRQEFTCLETKKISAETVHVLVVGGSLGAQVLNEVVPDAMAMMQGICVKHQTGAAMLETVQAHYQQLNIDAEVTAFIADMADAYQWADVVICRAGAMTVSELAAAGLPAILIPFPFAIDDHQTANAHYLVDAGGGFLIAQQHLSSNLLVEKMQQILAEWEVMATAAKSCAKLDATECVAAICASQVSA